MNKMRVFGQYPKQEQIKISQLKRKHLKIIDKFINRLTCQDDKNYKIINVLKELRLEIAKN